ncbi:MAG TPA: hypothetical protein VMF89_03945, partial [Polyangiales bacterium]|nr:hypothetical protein [Polyangiales bacterium]
MKLKYRLVLVIAGVTLFALACSFALVLVLVRRDETEDLDRALAAQAARALSRTSDGSEPLSSDVRVEIPEILGGVHRHIAVYGQGGALEHASKSFQGKAPKFADLGVTLPLPAQGVPVNSG